MHNGNHFILVGHGSLLKVSDRSCTRVPGRHHETLRWLCGDQMTDDQSIHPFVQAVATATESNSEAVAEGLMTLSLPHGLDTIRVKELAGHFSAVGVRPGLIAARSALAAASPRFSPNGSVHWLVDSGPNGLLLTRLDSQQPTSSGIHLDFAEAAFTQRQAVRDCFVREAGLRLVDVGVNDDDLERWLDEHLLTGEVQRRSLLAWQLDDGRRAEIRAATLVTRLEEIAKDVSSRVLHDWSPDDRDALVVEGWLARRFGVLEALNAELGMSRVQEFSLAEQRSQIMEASTDQWRATPGEVIAVSGPGAAPERIRIVSSPAAGSAAGSSYSRWKNAAIGSTIFSVILLVLSGVLWMRSSDGGAASWAEDVQQLEQSLASQAEEFAAEREGLENEWADERAELNTRIGELETKANADRQRLSQQLADQQAAAREERDRLSEELAAQTTAAERVRQQVAAKDKEIAELKGRLESGSRGVLTVPDQFKTIGEAMAAANAGDIIRVNPGTYRELITMKDGVTLMGDPAGGAIIQAPNSARTRDAVIRAPRGIKSAHIMHLVVDGNGVTDGILVVAGEVSVTNCTVRSMRFGILVLNNATHGVLKYNHISGGSSSGINIENGARGTVENNISENNRVGIVINGADILRARATLRNNTFRGNTSIGIQFSRGAGGTAENNICENNGEFGIYVSDAGTSPTLRSNTCRSNKFSGIIFRERAGGTAENNICESNRQSGIVIFGEGTSPILRRNTLRHNDMNGIYVQRGATPRGVQDNTVEGNGRIDIYIQQ